MSLLTNLHFVIRLHTYVQNPHTCLSLTKLISPVLRLKSSTRLRGERFKYESNRERRRKIERREERGQRERMKTVSREKFKFKLEQREYEFQKVLFHCERVVRRRSEVGKDRICEKKTGRDRGVTRSRA